MKSSTGCWVSGDDFFDRENELALFEARVRDGNHLLVTGQRRMGKTSILRELGRGLESDGWVFLFVDVEGAICPEDVIADMAREVRAVRPVALRAVSGMKRWFAENIDEISAFDFGIKFRAGLDAGSWRRHGENLLRGCAVQDKPVLLVLDELPIFLKRLFQRDGDADRVDEFLSWLRGVLQGLGNACPVLVVSGSIGLEPFVRRLGLTDRINYLHSVRVGPWNRDTSVACFRRLAPRARRCLEAMYSTVIPHTSKRIADTLDVLVHDGYLEASADEYRFVSRLLKDWWSARFRDHHVALEKRAEREEPAGS